MQDRAPSRRGESAPLAHACADAGRWLHREAFSHTHTRRARGRTPRGALAHRRALSSRQTFLDALQRPLPVTFRYTDLASAAYRREGERHLEAWAARGETRRLGLVDGWQLDIDKHALRALPGSDVAAVREWIVRGTDAGALVRQEVASMLPVALLLSAAPASGGLASARVLDMCASPGSKTTQIVEAIAAAADGTASSGVVVANDASPLRCYTLVKRTASLGRHAASLVVTCHCAQKMPAPPGSGDGGGGGYSLIVCDVPCTGDGTARKHPEVFSRWEPHLALRQHRLQLQIALRAAALLAVGGTMCYSTCSLNPIENEAVVAALLRRCGGALELVDGAAATASKLAGGCAPGMTTWEVLGPQLTRHPSAADLQASDALTAGEKRLFAPSMWPPPPASAEAAALRKCVRLLPHLSDSGGFFVALLRKRRRLPRHPAPRWHRKPFPAASPPAPPPATDAARTRNAYARVPPAVAARVAVPDGATALPLYARSAAARRVVALTPAAAAAIAAPNLHVVHAGSVVAVDRRRRRARCD